MAGWLIVALCLMAARATAQVAPAAPSALPPGAVVAYHPGGRALTVHVNGLPLQQLLDAIAAQTNIHFRLPPGQGLEHRPMTKTFDDLPLEQAIKQLLRETNYVMVYRTRLERPDTLARVEVLSLADAASTATPPSIASGPAQAFSPAVTFTPEELKQRRDERRKQQEEKKPGRAEKSSKKSGNRGGSSQIIAEPPTPTTAGGQPPTENTPPVK